MADPPRRPPAVPGIPGAKLPPPRPEPRKRQDTIPESPAPPSFGSTLESPPGPGHVDRSEAIGTVSAPLVVEPERTPQRQPAPRSISPVPWDPASRREAERQGPTSTPIAEPSRGAVRVQVGDVDVRVGSSVARRILPWLAPVLLSALGTAVGYAKGYFEGLAAAGRRVAAVEEGLRLNGEDDTRRDVKATKQINRAFVLLDDHDARIPAMERDLAKHEARLPKIEREKK